VSYAVIQTGGKQFKVTEGEVLRIPSVEQEVGSSIEFDQVLCVSNDSGVQVGNPLVEGARVVGKVLQHGRARKIIVFKFKRRKQYSRKRGHRQGFTSVKIESINV